MKLSHIQKWEATVTAKVNVLPPAPPPPPPVGFWDKTSDHLVGQLGFKVGCWVPGAHGDFAVPSAGLALRTGFLGRNLRG